MPTSQDTSPQATPPRDTQPAGRGARPPLRRAYDGRMLGGVCAGLADYLAADVTIVRVAFAVFTFLGGAGIPASLTASQRWTRRLRNSDQHIRVSDADRNAVAEVLTKHYADGRLDQAEFDERISRTMAGKTRRDLA